jgi:hypothetical protein
MQCVGGSVVNPPSIAAPRSGANRRLHLPAAMWVSAIWWQLIAEAVNDGHVDILAERLAAGGCLDDRAAESGHAHMPQWTAGPGGWKGLRKALRVPRLAMCGSLCVSLELVQ